MTPRFIYTAEDFLAAIEECDTFITNWSGREVQMDRDEVLELAEDLTEAEEGEVLAEVVGTTMYLG